MATTAQKQPLRHHKTVTRADKQDNFGAVSRQPEFFSAFFCKCKAALLTCSLAATSPTLLFLAKWVWMIRKQGLPIPLPTALVKFPSPALQHRLLSTTTSTSAAECLEEHSAVWKMCTGEIYGSVGRRLHAARWNDGLSAKL